MDSKDARETFARRIEREAGIKSAALVRGLATIPREDFVGSGPWKIMRPTDVEKGYVQTPDADPAHIYDTVLVALDAERQLNNGEPSSLVGWLDALKLNAGETFLHIGCGVGYYTAIASVAVSPDGKVVGVEVEPGLARQAELILASYPNIQVVRGNGTVGLPGPFDAIFVNAGCTHPLSVWLDHMAIGGRLLIPLTVESPLANIGFGLTLLITRRDDRYDAKFTGMAGIFHCDGARTERANGLLAESLSRGNSEVVSRLRRDEHVSEASCWLHGEGYCLSG